VNDAVFYSLVRCW